MFGREDHGAFKHIIVKETLQKLNGGKYTYKHKAAYHNFLKRWNELETIEDYHHELTFDGYMYASASMARKMKLASAIDNQKLLHILLPKILAVPACMLYHHHKLLIEKENVRKKFVSSFTDITQGIGNLNLQADKQVGDVLISPEAVASLLHYSYTKGAKEVPVHQKILIRALLYSGLRNRKFIH